MEWLIGAAALGLAAFFLFRGSAQASIPKLPQEGPPEPPGGPQPVEPGAGAIEPIAQPLDPLSAFLYMIRVAETGSRDLDAYSIYYGGSRFSNMSDHPVATGEKRGIPLPDRFCRAAGLAPGCVSTAAGAYQFILPTWRAVRQAGAWGPALPDFGIDSQDEGARRLLLQSGALAVLLAGNVEGAIARASSIWASLPGSTAQQGGKTLDQALALYREGLAAQG